MIHAWSNIETDEQAAWAHRRLDDAKALVKPRPDPDDDN